VQIFAALFLLLSLLALLGVRLSLKGDVVDRNSGWILLLFLIAIVFFIYSRRINDEETAKTRANKNEEKLLNKVRKNNLKNVKISRRL